MYNLFSVLTAFQLLAFYYSQMTAVSILPPSTSFPHRPHLQSTPQTLNPRAQYALDDRYTLHFYNSAYIMPIQISAVALTIWYTGVRRMMNLPMNHPDYKTFTEVVGYRIRRIKLTFTPLDPQQPGNLAMRSMAIAFVEWVLERAKEGFCEFYEASVSGPFGALMVSMELIEDTGGSAT